MRTDGEILLRAHTETLRDCRKWAQAARQQGDEKTARQYEAMAARLERKIDWLNDENSAR